MIYNVVKLIHMECKCSNYVSILFLYRMYIYSRPFFAICERFSEKTGDAFNFFFFKALFRFCTFLRLMVTQLQRMQEIILGPGWKEFFCREQNFCSTWKTTAEMKVWLSEIWKNYAAHIQSKMLCLPCRRRTPLTESTPKSLEDYNNPCLQRQELTKWCWKVFFQIISDNLTVS